MQITTFIRIVICTLILVGTITSIVVNEFLVYVRTCMYVFAAITATTIAENEFNQINDTDSNTTRFKWNPSDKVSQYLLDTCKFICVCWIRVLKCT